VDRADHVVRRLALASYAVPTGGIFGTGATDFFCGGVEKGSAALTALVRDPTTTLTDRDPRLLLVLARATHDLASRRAASPCAPAHVGRILSSAARMYASRGPGCSSGSASSSSRSGS
jgi:hypothetical protein